MVEAYFDDWETKFPWLSWILWEIHAQIFILGRPSHMAEKEGRMFYVDS